MANLILNTPGGINQVPAGKSLVGAKNNDGTVVNGFTNKLFVIDLENLPYIPRYSSAVFGDKTYQTVLYDTQEWTTENLDLLITGITMGDFYSQYGEPTAVYLKNEENYSKTNKYGLHYNVACISIINDYLTEGWRVPTYNDWHTLLEFIRQKYSDPEVDITKKIKSTTGWLDNNGTNEYGLSLVPAGWLDTTDPTDYQEHKQARLLYDEGSTDKSYTVTFMYNSDAAHFGDRNSNYHFPLRLVRDR